MAGPKHQHKELNPGFSARVLRAGLQRLRENRQDCHPESRFFRDEGPAFVLVPEKPMQILREVYPERSERAQDDSAALRMIVSPKGAK